MGWFSSDEAQRSKLEKAELERYKPHPKLQVSRKTQKSIKTATKRQEKVEKLRTKADVYEDEIRVRKAKEELKKKRRLAHGLPAKQPKKKKGYGYIGGVPVKKKSQTKTLSRKRRITLF